MSVRSHTQPAKYTRRDQFRADSVGKQPRRRRVEVSRRQSTRQAVVAAASQEA